MMRALCGDPSRVHATMRRANPQVRGESVAHLVFDFPDGAAAVVTAAWKHAGFTQGSVVVCGRDREAYYEGTLTRGEAGRMRVAQGGQVILDEARSPYDDYVESFYLLEREAADAMLGRGTVVQTASEHLRTLACTFAAYESARRGEPVSIAEFLA
jgi:predicted dehydrogenase